MTERVVYVDAYRENDIWWKSFMKKHRRKPFLSRNAERIYFLEVSVTVCLR